MATSDSKTTSNHDTIKKWVEARKGKPALIKGTDKTGKAGGLLRIKFSKDSGADLEEISWEQFFTIFDENNLQFLYQEETKDGDESRFFKFVD